MITKKALVMVDLQNDFCKGGSLEVPKGEEIISITNQLQTHFDLVVATKDWHPPGHLSFASNQPPHKLGDVVLVDDIEQILWPDHCVQNTNGAEFYPSLDTEKITKIFYKGTDSRIDSYSAFFDNAHRRQTGLGDFLRNLYVENVYILGLATDYCVKYSALDALHLGFNVYVIEDACRGIALQPDDINRAFEEMTQAGIKIIDSQNFSKG